ncbi:radical SAM protein [Saccharomonospora iraqiensis]|uniref:radical SAM protein n=1 Tax=Saccharomonospora iraqiensis TaxID=52698 RepID=UPI0003FC39AF|nr:radical SAM protein [Saccharomonospora iraqiensis]
MTVPAAHHVQASDPGRVWAPVVDQHATWIAVNPVQGCPKRCTYCFLNERGQTAVPPTQVASPHESVSLLLSSEFYGPSRPVAFYTWTDVMALPTSRAHLSALLGEWVRRAVPNPLVLITKCRVPDETIAAINSAREHGATVLVYLSYSGLSREVERGIRHDAIVDNFPRLAEAGVPIVHYWRPAFPSSADRETMCRVLDHAARYATCTVAAGLKVEPAALERMAKSWPELANTPGVAEAEGVYPRAFWKFIHRTWQRHPGYPVFHTNSCALSFVLDRADSFGVFGSLTCRVRNTCPVAQRERCTVADSQRTPPSDDEVRAALARRGVPAASFSLVGQGRELVIDAAVGTNVAAALTQDLGIRIRVARDGGDPYWSSGTAGATPVILP